MSSEDVLTRSLLKMSLRDLQDILRTFIRRLQNFFKTHYKYVFQTSSRRFQNKLFS